MMCQMLDSRGLLTKQHKRDYTEREHWEVVKLPYCTGINFPSRELRRGTSPKPDAMIDDPTLLLWVRPELEYNKQVHEVFFSRLVTRKLLGCTQICNLAAEDSKR